MLLGLKRIAQAFFVSGSDGQRGAGLKAEAGAEAALGEALSASGYVRARQEPRWREGDYLILSDVNRFVVEAVKEVGGEVFDYGCGGAPYAGLFAGCRRYVKADVVPGPAVDVVLPADGGTGEAGESYDWVFSTQVLEHVADPGRYLAECARILRPGGRLVLTTHGFYPEHGCPHDYHRWTVVGLVRAVEAAGMEVEVMGKLTTGVRAAVQLAHHCVWNLRVAPSRGGWSVFLGLVRKVYGWVGVPILNAWADVFPEQGVTKVTAPGAWYVGISVRARKPVRGESVVTGASRSAVPVLATGGEAAGVRDPR